MGVVVLYRSNLEEVVWCLGKNSLQRVIVHREQKDMMRRYGRVKPCRWHGNERLHRDV